ncbi:MAG: hypothetical protein MSC30_11100 [Gaiellaceae bacterium MAG52_C11]|nr:hypothetical protein [Candidatus Gaiellasilicea maunaloa]
MTEIELIAYGTLWTLLVLLGVLVLVLYRQLEKAYAARAEQAPAITAGSPAPAIEVVSPAGVEIYNFPKVRSRVLATFVSPSCNDCRKLLLLLREHFSGEEVVVFSSGEWSDGFSGAVDGFALRDLAHTWDAARVYGLSVFPTTFAIEDGKVMGHTTQASLSAIRELLEAPSSETVLRTGNQGRRSGTATDRRDGVTQPSGSGEPTA